MKILKWLGIALLVLIVLVVVIGALVADIGFNALRDSARIKHDTRPEFTSGVRVMIQPQYASFLLRETVWRKMPEAPGWLVDYMLPYEITAQSVPDLTGNTVPVNLFFNTRRFGPMYKKFIPRIIEENPRGAVEWDVASIATPGRGVVTMRGTLPLDPPTKNAIAERWGETTIPTPLPMEGTHLAELRADNRGGALYAFISAILADQAKKKAAAQAEADPAAPKQPGMNDFQRDALVKVAVKDITDIHITVDLEESGLLTLMFSLEFAPDHIEETPAALVQQIDVAVAQIQQNAERNGITVEGSHKLEGLQIQGSYTADNILKLLPPSTVPAS